MGNILTDDVRTYVSKLIEKELGSIIKMDNISQRNRKADNKPISKPEKDSEQLSPSGSQGLFQA